MGTSSARRHRERRLEAASGYLELEMAGHALKALDEIKDPEAIPFDFNRLRGEALKTLGRWEPALRA